MQVVLLLQAQRPPLSEMRLRRQPLQQVAEADAVDADAAGTDDEDAAHSERVVQRQPGFVHALHCRQQLAGVAPQQRLGQGRGGAGVQ